MTALDVEVARLRREQQRCADAAHAATTEAERVFAMLGVNDYLLEELLLLYWHEQIAKTRAAPCP